MLASSVLLVPFMQAALADSPPPLVSSIVYNPDGTPAKNATVKMLLIPTTDSTTLVKQTVIATTTTDDSGNFSFISPNLDTTVLNAALQNGGILNVGLLAMPDYEVSPPGTGVVDNAPDYVFALEYTSFKLQQTQFNVPSEFVPDDEADQLNPLTMVGIPPADPSFDAPPLVANPVSCDGPYTRRVGDPSYPQSPVMDLHTYLDMSAQATYGKTADSVIGMGWSRSWNNGWSVDGSAHVANSNGSSVGWSEPDHFAHTLSTKIQVNEYDTVQYCPSQTYHYYQSVPQKWIPSTYVGTANLSGRDGSSAFWAQPISHQNDFAPRSHFKRDSTKGYQFTAGVKTPWNFSADIRSGFSTNVTIYYSFGSANYTHNLFGRDGNASTATTIYAY